MSSYEAIIESNRPWFYFDWKGFLQYRDLLWMMVRREFVSKYKQTLLGPLWFVVQPLLTALLFFFVFSSALKISTGSVPPMLFYLSGLLVWNYLSITLNTTSMSLVANAHLFKQVYFPRLIIPLSYSISFLITVAVQLGVFLAFYFYYKTTPLGAGFHPTPLLLLAPFALLQIAALSFGMGLWVASLTVRYRDFHHLLSFTLMLWMYATPISYPAELVPRKFNFLVKLNPANAAIGILRKGFFGQGTVAGEDILYAVGLTLAVLISGLVLFNRIERTFIDRI